MQTIKTQKSAITLGAPSSPSQATIFCHWWRSIIFTYGRAVAAYTCLDLDLEVWTEYPGGVMQIMGVSGDALTICLF